MRIESILTSSLIVILGSTARAQSLLYGLGAEATSGDWFGWTVADAGDVDADGFPDIAVGSPRDSAGGTFAGAVYVYSGRNGALLRTWLGPAAGEWFGFSVDGLGDVDGDGHSDVLVGAPLHKFGALSFCGAVYLVSGATGLVLRSHVGTVADTQVGYLVRGLGDIDGDGVGDYASSQPLYDDGVQYDCGRVELRSGATGALFGTYTGAAYQDNAGWSIDVVKAGPTLSSTRIVIGIPGYLNDNRGRIVLVNGSASAIGYRSGNYVDGAMGISVAGIGDVDGDGSPDFAVGEPGADLGGTDSGNVLVFSQSATIPLHKFTGAALYEKFGTALSRLGDWSGDGVGDLLAGMPSLDIGSAMNAGRARVISSVDGAELAVWSGSAGNYYGYCVDAFDPNRDGVLDALIGAPEASSEGRAFARLAGTTSPSVYCTAKTNSIGCVPSISATGISSLTIGDSFHVVASNVLNQKSGFLFWGHVATATPFWDATMCVALPRWRTPPQFSNGTLVGVDCTGSYDLHFSNAYMATVPISAGDTLFAQYWSRDPFLAAPNSFGLTAGIQFLVVP